MYVELCNPCSPTIHFNNMILIKSDLKWCVHLSRSLFSYFNYFVSVTAGGPESPRGHAHVAKFYGRLRLILSVLRASKFTVLNWLKLQFCWFITPSLLALACFGTFWTSILNFLNYFVCLRITDEGSVPEMRIWSILLIKSDLKWCIHASDYKSLLILRKLKVVVLYSLASGCSWHHILNKQLYRTSEYLAFM